MRLSGVLQSVIVASLLVSLSFCTGCMGMVYARQPKTLAREKSAPVEMAPSIDLSFQCSEPEAEATISESSGTNVCCRCPVLKESLIEVMEEFDYLAHAAEGVMDPEYRLVVHVEWAEDHKVAPVGSEGCVYFFLMLTPCITRERLSTTFQLFTSDGPLVASGEASAKRVLFSHFGLIWTWPVGIPWWPATIRFSKNRYRNLLAQVERVIAELPHSEEIPTSIPELPADAVDGT